MHPSMKRQHIECRGSGGRAEGGGRVGGRLCGACHDTYENSPKGHTRLYAVVVSEHPRGKPQGAECCHCCPKVDTFLGLGMICFRAEHSLLGL